MRASMPFAALLGRGPDLKHIERTLDWLIRNRLLAPGYGASQ